MDCNFLNLGGCHVIRYESFLTIFSVYTQQIAVRLVAIKRAYFSPYVYSHFHFSRTLPVRIVNVCSERKITELRDCQRNFKRLSIYREACPHVRLTTVTRKTLFDQECMRYLHLLFEI